MNEHNNNPNNVNTTEDSLFDDMPELISDAELESDTEEELQSHTDYSDMPELLSDTESEPEFEPESDTDYSDMPELVSIDETELINRLRYSFQSLQNTNKFSIDSEDSEDSKYEDDDEEDNSE